MSLFLFFPLLSGILISTSFTPFYPWALLFGFSPLWWYWLRKKDLSVKQIFLQACLCQFILNLIGFYWLSHTFQQYAGLNSFVSGFLLVFVANFLSYYIPLAAVLWAWGRSFYKSQASSLLALTSLFFLLESTLPQIFSWNLGYGFLEGAWPGAHIASVIGFSGLSGLTFLANALFSWAFFKKSYLKPALILTLSFALISFWGVLLKRNLSPPDKKISILAMQLEYNEVSRQARSRNSLAVLNKYLELSREALKKHPEAQVIVWPETAFQGVLRDDRKTRLTLRLEKFVREIQRPLITGGFYKKGEKIFTGFLIFEPGGRVQKYLKTKLLMFGEYLPFENLLSVFDLRKKIVNIGQFSPGRGAHVLKLKNLSQDENEELILGPQVCYEGLDSSFSRTLARQKAQVFFNITNDSWYGPHSQPYQHFLITAAKAIEYRRPVVRVTNTGLTGYALSQGEIFYDPELYKNKGILLEVPYSSKPQSTFYEKYPHLMVLLFLFILIFTIVSPKRYMK